MYRKIVNAITFCILSAFVLLYYGMIYFELQNFFAYNIFLVGFVLLLIGLFVEFYRILHKKYVLVQELEIIAIALIGGLATFILSTFNFAFNINPLGPVIAAGVVGLFGSEILQKLKAEELAAPLYCGAFVGMSSGIIFSFESIAIASLIAGFLYIAAHELYSGIGGTLGTIAFVCTTIVRKIFGG